MLVDFKVYLQFNATPNFIRGSKNRVSFSYKELVIE